MALNIILFCGCKEMLYLGVGLKCAERHIMKQVALEHSCSHGRREGIKGSTW